MRGIGRTRIKLASVLSEHFKTQVRPEDLERSHGPGVVNGNDKFVWEAFITINNVTRVYYSFNTMSLVAKHGVCELRDGELCANV